VGGGGEGGRGGALVMLRVTQSVSPPDKKVL